MSNPHNETCSGHSLNLGQFKQRPVTGCTSLMLSPSITDSDSIRFCTYFIMSVIFLINIIMIVIMIMCKSNCN